jgi:hypothetical protein
MANKTITGSIGLILLLLPSSYNSGLSLVGAGLSFHDTTPKEFSVSRTFISIPAERRITLQGDTVLEEAQVTIFSLIQSL